MTQRLVAVASHPVQYQAPYFRALAARPEVDFRALYCFLPTPEEQGEGFGASFVWDVPVLEGYPWREIPGIRRHGASPHGYRALSAPAIGGVLEEERPDAVLITGWHSRPLVQASRAARRRRIPLLLRGDSNDLPRRPLWKRVGHRVFFRRFAAFLAVGAANRRLYERAGAEPRRIFHVPHAVDNERFARMAAELRPRRRELRETWRIDPNAVVQLFAGKHEPKKHVGDLFDALEIARRGRIDLRLLVVGSGALERELREKAAALRLPVTFAGFLNQRELPRAYGAADVLVLPSESETWGLVVNEAMASSLPAVVSDGVGCREDLIEEGVTGFSFPCGDVRALAACLTTIAADAERTAAMGEAARARVMAGYSIDKVVEGTLAALAAATGGGRK